MMQRQDLHAVMKILVQDEEVIADDGHSTNNEAWTQELQLTGARADSHPA